MTTKTTEAPVAAPETVQGTPAYKGSCDSASARIPDPTQRGGELLTATGHTNQAIAERLGVSAESVRLWKRGRRTPNDEQREAILAAFGVPTASWDVPAPWNLPVGERPPPQQGPMGVQPSEPASDSPIDQLRAQIADVNDEFGRTSSAFDRAKLHSVKLSALSKLADLEADAKAGHVYRRRLDAAIEALAPFPEAREAVAKAWEALREVLQ